MTVTLGNFMRHKVRGAVVLGRGALETSIRATRWKKAQTLEAG